jgi:hypothetical protein
MRSALCLTAGMVAYLATSMMGQASPAKPPVPSPYPVPVYRVSFERGQLIPAVSSSSVIKWPLQCSDDGTIFASFVSTARAGSGLPPPPPGPPTSILTSISRAGQARTFRLDQVPNLYISGEEDHYVSDSEVIFLVRASRENNPVKRAYTVGDYQGEKTVNAAEQHLYVVTFNRDAEYQRTAQIADLFKIQKIGLFPSGSFLVFGFDKSDYSAKLAMLKADGTLLKTIDIPKDGDAPPSTIGGGGASSTSRHSIAPSQLIPEGHSIVIAQRQGGHLLIEVSEGGEARAIRPKLPETEDIKSLIPSDHNLYVIAASKTEPTNSHGSIYEIDPVVGTLMRTYVLGGGVTADALACVIDGRFLSIDYGEGGVVPIVGSAEPASAAP